MPKAALQRSAFAAKRADDYLGPAEVVEAGDGEVCVALEDGTVARVRAAFAVPYEPAVGDVLLVIGRADAHYAIGVLRGSGKVTLSFEGDVEVRSIGGKLTLSGGKGVEVSGPEVDVQAGKIRIFAEAMVQKLGSLHQRIRALLSVHARESHTVVDEGSHAQSKSAVIVTEETVTINGKQVHLG